MKDSDSPFDVAWELIDSSGWIPNREEAREWVAYNCDHWGIARRAEILFALGQIRKEEDLRIAYAKVQEDERLALEKNPYRDHPVYGTWG